MDAADNANQSSPNPSIPSPQSTATSTATGSTADSASPVINSLGGLQATGSRVSSAEAFRNLSRRMQQRAAMAQPTPNIINNAQGAQGRSRVVNAGITGDYMWTITALDTTSTSSSGDNTTAYQSTSPSSSNEVIEPETNEAALVEWMEHQFNGDNITVPSGRLRVRPTTVAYGPTTMARRLRQLAFGPDGSFTATTAAAQPQLPIQQSNNSGQQSSRAGNPLRNKVVYALNCRYCQSHVCNRSMRAILLADTKVELYSTDIPPSRTVGLVDGDRQTQGCRCRIRDTACKHCGCVLGYHVSQPCERCLDARNNGHFWMFYAEGVECAERKRNATMITACGDEKDNLLYWNQLTPMLDECEQDLASASPIVSSKGKTSEEAGVMAQR